jgi:hypothetical protein
MRRIRQEYFAVFKYVRYKLYMQEIAGTFRLVSFVTNLTIHVDAYLLLRLFCKNVLQS